LNLLAQTPLCVCHFQDVLGESQVNISKHLRYLKNHGLVEVRQHRNWRIYQLPEKRGLELERQLKCLQDCVQEEKIFRDDLKRLKNVSNSATSILNDCAAPTLAKKRSKTPCCK
jgi:ArsR family transcriptional regulator